jgi:hypothetical protein
MPDQPAVIIFEAKILGLTADNQNALGYHFDFTMKTDGTDADVVGIQFSTRNTDSALSDADAEVTFIDNEVIIEVQGVAGQTINWTLEVNIVRSE